MKIKNGYILREVAGSTVVVPFGADNTFASMLKLNETGKLLWEALMEGAQLEDLCAALVREYEIDAETARADAEKFVASLQRQGILE